eukprot:UN07274
MRAVIGSAICCMAYTCLTITNSQHSDLILRGKRISWEKTSFLKSSQFCCKTFIFVT